MFEECKELMEYSIFVKRVEEFAEEPDITTEQAVCKAVDYCIEHDIMKEFMEVHREEVSNMFTEEFDYDRAIEIAKEEAREDDKASSIKKMMKNLKLTAEAAMEALEIPKSEYPKYMAML